MVKQLKELYDRLLAEFSTWLREAKFKGIIDYLIKGIIKGTVIVKVIFH